MEPLNRGTPWDLVLTGLVAVVYAIYILRRRWSYKCHFSRDGPPQAEEAGKQANANQSRAFGEWIPEHFVYPTVVPCTERLEDIQSRVYRPFKGGDYHVTMGIRAMDWNDWIELDNELPTYHRIRCDRIATRGHKLVQVVPDRPIVCGGAEAALELVHELAEFLSKRYPKVYAATRENHGEGPEGSGRITTMTIQPLNVTYDLEKDDPMCIVASLTQDDFAILIEGKDGQYYLQAGAIVVPGGWRLEDKVGMPLDEIHFSGEVPYYAEKLQRSMNRFFRRIETDSPVVRNNWFFHIVGPSITAAPIDPEELAWNSTVFGLEDDYPHPTSSYARERAAEVPDKSSATKSRAVQAAPTPSSPSPENIRLRSERQSLRRLPRTGAVVFTIRTYLTPVVKLAREPGMPGRLAAALRGVQASSPDIYQL
ncbi:hypothetical protein OF83DRAFT_1165304 [Amylostereum chailletii]|nr:hypothetical protein OF83DRAFT_1165304 [Amylostereum chailletii]